MPVIWSFFAALAALGFAASVVAHIGGYLGLSDPFGMNPWPLHMGIFVVWLPAVIVAQKLSRDFPQKDLWKVALRGCPKWMRIGLYVMFAYTFASFAFFFLTTLDTKDDNDAATIRGFSGHWLFFYYAAFAILYSAIQVSKDDPVRRCGNGHIVGPADKFCPTCGHEIRSTTDAAS